MADEKITQGELDALKSLALQMVTGPKLQKLEVDLKNRESLSLENQASFVRRVIAKLEDAEVADYGPAPIKISGKKSADEDDSTNPWSSSAWNTTKQSALVKTLGEAKARQIANAAGCDLGSTRPGQRASLSQRSFRQA